MKGTCDFLGIGHFTTRYITHKSYPSARSGTSYFTDRDLAELVDPRWPDPGSEWLYSVPWGFRRLLNFVKVTRCAVKHGEDSSLLHLKQYLLCLQTQYGNPMIYVTENGVSEKMSCTELCDEWRIQYYKDYINEMLKGSMSSWLKKRKNKQSLSQNSHHIFLSFSYQRWGEREGLHRLVPAGQV